MSIDRIHSQDPAYYENKREQEAKEPKNNDEEKVSIFDGNSSDDIRINTYDVASEESNVAPQTSSIDLNNYYHLGYKNDEQNKDEAKKIREDIISLYSLDPHDPNLEEKLAVIYQNIINNENNKPLNSYVSEKILPNKTEKFNQRVEDSLAHMSHDGSSVGDQVTLETADFSKYFVPIDVSYNEKPKIVINNSEILEFDGNIIQDEGIYSGIVKGKRVTVERNQDSSCTVKYYIDSSDSTLTKEITYSTDSTRITSAYARTTTGEHKLAKKFVEDKYGNKISDYENYGNYALERYNDGGYALYDSDGKLQNIVSVNENDNSSLTVTRYGDRTRTDIISEDVCFKYDTPENISKYKFSTGNQYSVEINDTGSGLIAQVSSGSLNTSYVIEQNNQGLYELNGKKFLNLDELAAEMNNIEIQPSTDADGIISVSHQGFGVGDCGVLSAVNALSYTEAGREVLKDSLVYNDDGSMTVNFFGLNRSYTVSKEELESTDTFSFGDKDVIGIEIALNQANTDIVYGNTLIYDDAPYWCRRPNELTSESFLITATFPQNLFYLLSGKECSFEDCPSFEDKQNMLNELQYNGGIAINCSTFNKDGTRINVTNAPYDCTVGGISVPDAFGNTAEIVSGHAYAVKEVNTKTDGTRVVTVINPWDSGKEIVLDEDIYLYAFESSCSMQIRNNEYYPVYYF